MEKSEEIKNVMLKSWEAFQNGDAEYWMSFVSQEPGVVLTGTDPKEWWRGYEKIVHDLRSLWQKKKKFTWTADIRAYKENTVGWYDGTMLLKYDDGSELPFRVTGVLHQENHQWKLVQSNLALEVPDENIKKALKKPTKSQ